MVTAAGVRDLLLLPLRLLGVPTSIDPTALLAPVLSLGPVPEHIAFIMDGNRRFARSSSLSIQEGHLSGFQTLKEVLEACLNLGVRCVTVYAFAIDNFKRDTTEVDALMQLAKTRLLELAGHGQVISRHSVRVRIIGRKHLLPPDVRAAINKVEAMTKSHSGAILNICMPYASRDEIAFAVRGSVAAHLRRSSSRTSVEIHPDDIEDHLMLAHSPPLDLLVRTSGVNRLSDFMLWQANGDTRLHFTDCYWPDFGWRQLAPILLDYQRHKVADAMRRYIASFATPPLRASSS